MADKLWLICLIIHLFATISLLSQSNGCRWGNFTLQALETYDIQCIDGMSAYGYTPCRSAALCMGAKYGAVYYNRNTGQCQYYLAEWDDGETVPIYSLQQNTIQWSFNYTNGQSCYGNERTFEIIWSCNHGCSPFCNDTICGMIDDNECHHQIEIQSVYACVNGTEPENQCIFKASNNDEYILNISSLMGRELFASDPKNNSLYYIYTPCNNSLTCDGRKAMSYRYDINAQQCLQYLAIWENGLIQPNYSENEKKWEFVYTNGEECNGLQNIFVVNWICDKTANISQVTASEISECVYQMVIRSTIACV